MNILTRDDAQTLGCKRYYDGDVCASCNTKSPRFTKSGKCVFCIARNRKKFYDNNPEKTKQRTYKTKKKDPVAFKEKKDRARLKLKARKEWAENEAYKIVMSGDCVSTKIKSINYKIDEDGFRMLSCSIKDLVELRDVLTLAVSPPDDSPIPTIPVCNFCAKVFTNRNFWKRHKCTGRLKQLTWIVDNVPRKLIATRIWTKQK